MSDQVAIGFRFASGWLRGWSKFSKPITECSVAKSLKSQITLDTQLKIALAVKMVCKDTKDIFIIIIIIIIIIHNFTN